MNNGKADTTLQDLQKLQQQLQDIKDQVSGNNILSFLEQLFSV